MSSIQCKLAEISLGKRDKINSTYLVPAHQTLGGYFSAKKRQISFALDSNCSLEWPPHGAIASFRFVYVV